ncbi:MAG: hypothetical protein LBH44_04310 [Treponema sp.]|jgi:hypothetical protein|nr:hypothetical protein [Treponema sp.]
MKKILVLGVVAVLLAGGLILASCDDPGPACGNACWDGFDDDDFDITKGVQAWKDCAEDDAEQYVKCITDNLTSTDKPKCSC